ncbi:MAG: hypothetical protein PHE84_01285 [bacterium]|nr:hypothetical protein [bacterium]
MSRWTDYYLNHDFDNFWRRHTEEGIARVLIILGVGFDPRCLHALRLLAGLGLGDRLGYIALKLIARPALGKSGIATDKLSKENVDELVKIGNCRPEALFDIETHDAEGHNIAGRRTLLSMEGASKIFKNYTDILIDISGMPRGVFFPLIAYLLRLADNGEFRNLHVCVVEDPLLDSKISGREFGQADYLHTFRYQGEEKLVWLPLVGKDETARLEKIHNKIKGSCVEICPMLPFPASSLRRVDDVAVRHSELLFEGFLVSPDNLLLCNERNPFDVYRKILEVEEYYRQRLSAIPAIGKVITVVSPLSSKTLSLGMLLAAVERSLPVCYVEAGTYQVDVDMQGRLVGDTRHEPTEIWLAGEPYIA